jgi:hypothetical protein
MSKNPSDLGVDLHIAQLYREGAVETTWPSIHPYGHLLLAKQLDPMAEKGPHDLRACQHSSQQYPNDLTQGLHPVKDHLSHTIPPIGLGDGAATYEHGEQRVSVVPHKQPCYPPPVQRTKRRELEVGINSKFGPDKDIHITQSRRFHARALL